MAPVKSKSSEAIIPPEPVAPAIPPAPEPVAPATPSVLGGRPAPVPTVGRIVLYCEVDGIESAAIIVRVYNATCVNLRTFPDSNESHFQTRNLVVEGVSPGCWKWPPRV